MLNQKKSFLFPSEVRVVEASAGSGKTYCLARRYVQLLLSPKGSCDQAILRNILALTFTNKAAYTMKARILELLKKMALGQISVAQEQEILQPIGLSLSEVRPIASRVMDELIHQYNFFQVQTIDSFINSLLSGCAFKIGLSAGFKIRRNYSEYLERSFDRLIDQGAADRHIENILARFLQSYLFLENKSGWFPKKDMFGLLNALYSQSNTYGKDFAMHDPTPSADSILALKKKIVLNLRELQNRLPAGVYKKFRDGLEKFLLNNDDGFDFDDLSTYLSWETVPVTKGENVPADLDRLWDRIRKDLRELSEKEAFSLFDPYVQVFNQIHSDFQRQAQLEDILFLPELNRRARELFDEGMVTVEELYYRLATRFHHYLLDEFQDTSVLQWQNLELMIEEALSTGGTLFYVGDKKQAIYGFRGGEVRLFDDVKTRFANFNVQLESLTKNYRSEKAVVAFNNRIFSPENLRRYVCAVQEQKDDVLPLSGDDLLNIENIFHGSQQQVPPGHERGYVRIEAIEDHQTMKDSRGTISARNDEIRHKLLTLLRELKQRFSYRQIAILTRSNTEIEEVTGWLMAEGIFVESERTLNIKKNALIRELIALMRFLDSPIDHLSFAQFISGEIFASVSGLRQEEVRDFLFQHRPTQGQQGGSAPYRVFRDQYPEVWKNWLNDFFNHAGLYPLYELMSSMMHRYRLFHSFPDEQGFFLRFLELIKEKEEDFSDLSSFLEQYEDFENDVLFVNVVNSDAIKILTTHKAKGLEFPVVIIPFLGMKIHAASGISEAGQQSYIVDSDEDHDTLKLLRIKKKYLPFSPQLAEIDRKQRVLSFISEINSVYVALTRASKELYAFLPSKMGNSHNLLIPLIPRDAYVQGQPADYPQESGNESDENQLGLPASGDHDWIGFLKEEFVDSNRVFHREKIRYGMIMHDLLSGIGNIHLGDLEKMMGSALRATQTRYPQIIDWEPLEKDLRRIVTSSALKFFFAVEKGQVFLEKEIFDAEGRTHRIDRLIDQPQIISVIDFKSTREGRESYVVQVRTYMAILEELHPEKTVKGFLIYLDQGDFEEVV